MESPFPQHLPSRRQADQQAVRPALSGDEDAIALRHRSARSGELQLPSPLNGTLVRICCEKQQALAATRLRQKLPAPREWRAGERLRSAEPISHVSVVDIQPV